MLLSTVADSYTGAGFCSLSGVLACRAAGVDAASAGWAGWLDAAGVDVCGFIPAANNNTRAAHPTRSWCKRLP